MASLKQFEKTPVEVVDYPRRWNKILNGETIDTSEWATKEGNVTIDSDSTDGNKTIVRLSGGDVGVRDVITNTIVTDGGQTLQRSFEITIVEFRAE